MSSDYLIVGSGLAGLSVGALLARSGAPVRVLEAHYSPGGYGHTFVEGAYRFNAQLHYVWNCGEGRAVDNFLRKLGLAEAVTFEEYDRQGFDRMRMPGYERSTFPADLVVARRSARTAAPAGRRRAAIRAFLGEVALVAEGLERSRRRSRRPLASGAAPGGDSPPGPLAQGDVCRTGLRRLRAAAAGADAAGVAVAGLHAAAGSGSRSSSGCCCLPATVAAPTTRPSISSMSSNRSSSVIRDSGGELLLRHRVRQFIVEGTTGRRGRRRGSRGERRCDRTRPRAAGRRGHLQHGPPAARP